MKTLLTIVLTIVGLVAGIFALVMGATAPVAKAADSFFEAWSTGQPQLSYPYLSQGFKQVNSADKLSQFMVANRLNNQFETSWNNRSINNSAGKLEGDLTRYDGSKMLVVVNLIKEEDLWKIDALHFTTPTLTANNSVYPPNTQNNGGQTPTRSFSNDRFDKDHAVRPTASIGAGSSEL